MADRLPPHAPKDAALVLEGLSKTYPVRRLFSWRAATGTAHVALQHVSLQVREGETIGLLGPNGAGKTTLLKIIATLLYPNTGRVWLDGRDIFEQPRQARGSIGLVTCDERSFYWRLTGRHNLRFFASLYGLSHRQATERIDRLLETLGLSAAADRRYDGYSSGMKQKLAIARGLLSNPRLVLYDEPTRSLDPLSTQNVRQWIRDSRTRNPHQLHVIATNRLDEAEQLCDRVFIINRGVITAQGTIQEIHDKWQRRDYDVHRITYDGQLSNGRLQPDPANGLLEVVEEHRSDQSATVRLRTLKTSDALSRALETILRDGGRVTRCEAEQPRFDEVFCALVLGNGEEGSGNPAQGELS